MSQAANTFWANRYESPGRVKSPVRRKSLSQRIIDAAILAIIIAACALCVSVYLRTRSELSAAMAKNQVAADKAQALSAQIEKLARDVNQLQTDAKTIEQFARQKYGYVRAGDVVIKVAQGEGEQATVTQEVRVANLTPQSSGSYTDISN